MHDCSVALHAFANGTTTPPQQRGWYDLGSKTESVTGAMVPDGYAAAGLIADALATHGRPDAVRVRVCHAATRVLLSEMVWVRLLLGDSDERVLRRDRVSDALTVSPDLERDSVAVSLVVVLRGVVAEVPLGVAVCLCRGV